MVWVSEQLKLGTVRGKLLFLHCVFYTQDVIKQADEIFAQIESFYCLLAVVTTLLQGIYVELFSYHLHHPLL